MKQQKPYKHSVANYYVVSPVRNLTYFIKRRILGRWYCQYCHKYHGRRVDAYPLYTCHSISMHLPPVMVRATNDPLSSKGKSLTNNCKCVCSLGAAAIKEDNWQPDYIVERKDYHV